MTGKTEAGQRTTIDKNTPSIDLTQIKKIQQDIHNFLTDDINKMLCKPLPYPICCIHGNISHKVSIYCNLFQNIQTIVFKGTIQTPHSL
jgi:hypothetical protein